MQGADNDSDLLQNTALYGGRVLHGEPVSLPAPEGSLHLLRQGQVTFLSHVVPMCKQNWDCVYSVVVSGMGPPTVV